MAAARNTTEAVTGAEGHARTLLTGQWGEEMSRGEEGMLVGTWDLVSLVSERPDGSTFEPFGPHPSGRTIYDVAGHVIGMIVCEQRNEANGIPNPLDFQSQFTAYFGTYRVDTQTGEVVHTVTTSLNGYRASGELRRHYNVENDILLLSFAPIRDGEQVTSRLVWRRISP
jgi:hypothetical protein